MLLRIQWKTAIAFPIHTTRINPRAVGNMVHSCFVLQQNMGVSDRMTMMMSEEDVNKKYDHSSVEEDKAAS